MNKQEARRWARYWIDLAKKRLQGPRPITASARRKKFSTVADALEHAEEAIEELESLGE